MWRVLDNFMVEEKFIQVSIWIQVEIVQNQNTFHISFRKQFDSAIKQKQAMNNSESGISK